MTNNDIMRRVRFIFDFNDKKMMDIFKSADCSVSREQVSAWLKKEDDPGYVACEDRQLATFLNGLINIKRGKREGAQPEPEHKINNNMVLVKLKIALNLKAEELLNILKLADFALSKHELSAFFRNVNHKHYRECKDQVLRNFLTGLQRQYRPGITGNE